MGCHQLVDLKLEKHSIILMLSSRGRYLYTKVYCRSFTTKWAIYECITLVGPEMETPEPEGEDRDWKPKHKNGRGHDAGWMIVTSWWGQVLVNMGVSDWWMGHNGSQPREKSSTRTNVCICESVTAAPIDPVMSWHRHGHKCPGSVQRHG